MSSTVSRPSARPLPRQRSLSTYEGWKDFAERPARRRPELLTPTQLDGLEPAVRAGYDADRRAWHANILLRTRSLEIVHTQLTDIIDSNLQDSDRIKSAAAIDAPPALGKSTVVNTFGRIPPAADHRSRRVPRSG